MLPNRRKLNPSLRRISLLSTVKVLAIFVFVACSPINPKDVKIDYGNKKRSADRIEEHSLIGTRLVSNSENHLFSLSYYFEGVDEPASSWRIMQKTGESAWHPVSDPQTNSELWRTDLINRPGTPEMYIFTCESRPPRPESTRLYRFEADRSLTDISDRFWGHLTPRERLDLGVTHCKGEFTLAPNGDVLALKNSSVWRLSGGEPTLLIEGLATALGWDSSCVPRNPQLDVSSFGEVIVHFSPPESCAGPSIFTHGVFRVQGATLVPIIELQGERVSTTAFGPDGSLYVRGAVATERHDPDGTDYRSYVVPPGELPRLILKFQDVLEDVSGLTVTPDGWIHMFYRGGGGAFIDEKNLLLSFRPLEPVR